MEKQKVTLVLPKKLLREIRRIAAERGTSMSALMVTAFEKLVPRDDAYERARERALYRLRNPFDLGLTGERVWTRDELHERR